MSNTIRLTAFTPIFRFPSNSPFLNIVIKREDLSETGSHKFRYIKQKLKKLQKEGVKAVVLSTTGNAGITASYYGKKLGIKVIAVMSDRGEMDKAEQTKKNNGEVILTPQPMRTARELARQHGIPLLRASRDEEAVKSYESLGEELIHQVPRTDAIVNFCTSGTSSAGIMRAYARLKKPLPALHIVQSGRSASIVKTLHPELVPKNHDQNSVGLRDTHRRKEILEWIQKSHGDGWYVTGEDRKKAEKILLNHGLETSLEGVSSFAAGTKIAAQYDSVAVIFSGRKWKPLRNILPRYARHRYAAGSLAIVSLWNDDEIASKFSSLAEQGPRKDISQRLHWNQNTDRETIYITLDLRRALFVPESSGAMIICSYSSDLLSTMRKMGAQIWCFEEQYPDEKPPTKSAELIGNGKTLRFLKSLGKNLSFLVFKPSNRVRYLIEKNGWQLISPNTEACRKLEDKVSFYDLAKQYKIPIPKSEIITWDLKKIPKLHQQFGQKFVVQGRMGHAGSSTWIVNKNRITGPSERGGILKNSQVKISEWVAGTTYTINGYASPHGKLVISPLFEQLMGVPEWNPYPMGTIGVSPTTLPKKYLLSLKTVLLKLSPLFQELKFFGFFGLDLIFDGKQWFLLECNPRFTATISLQCLIDVQNKRKPLLRYHAEQSEPEEHRFDFMQKNKLLFGHIILRNSKLRPWKIPKTLKSGIYHHQDGHWKFRKRTFDASELQKNEPLFILANSAGTWIESGSDFATIQFIGTAKDKINRIHDRFFDFYERVVMRHLIRKKDFFKNTHVKTRQITSIFKHPHEGILQTEALPREVIQLLGKYQDFLFVQRADGTKGWIKTSTPVAKNIDKKNFVLPHQSSTTSEAFFQHWKGTPYRRGGNTEQGIDCSAFTQRYFWEVKGVLLPKHSRDQKAVSKSTELIFMKSGKAVPHVGIRYQGKIWHACLRKGVVGESPEEVQQRYKIFDS